MAPDLTHEHAGTLVAKAARVPLAPAETVHAEADRRADGHSSYGCEQRRANRQLALGKCVLGSVVIVAGLAYRRMPVGETARQIDLSELRS